jgi:hypothetical protein
MIAYLADLGYGILVLFYLRPELSAAEMIERRSER